MTYVAHIYSVPFFLSKMVWRSSQAVTILETSCFKYQNSTAFFFIFGFLNIIRPPPQQFQAKTSGLVDISAMLLH